MSHDQYIPSATLSDILMLNESELMNGEEDGSMVPMSPGRSRSNDTGETLSFLKHFNTPETWRLMSFDEKDFDKKTGDFNPRDLPGFFLDDDKEERTKKQKKSSNAKKEKTEKTTKKNKKDNFFGVSTTSRTTRDGKVSYFKIKVKHKGTEYYLGIRKDKFESVMVADAGYILVGELQKSNLERARKYVARDPSIQGSFDKYVQRLSDAMVSVLKDKIIEINTKPISDERKEKTQTLWKDGIRAKWGATPSSSSVRIDSYRERFKGTSFILYPYIIFTITLTPSHVYR